jgi:hypothetical protein
MPVTLALHGPLPSPDRGPNAPDHAAPIIRVSPASSQTGGPSAIELDPVQPRRAMADIERGARIVSRRAASGEPPMPDKPSLAVMPFQNMRHDPEQEYLADGMVEETITAL